MSIQSDKVEGNIVVRVERLSKHFAKKKALDEVSITVRRGRVFGLVGENGAGKTTLIHHIMGSYIVEQGCVEVFGMNPVEQPQEVLSRIGYLSETRDLPRWMRIEQFLVYMSAFYPKWDMGYAKELLEQFGLEVGTKIGGLSRGELARLGLTAALSHRPELLVLDEPSSGLDPVARIDILTAVVRSVAEEGRTVFFSSHLLDEVERVSDDVCLIHKGKVIFEGELEEIRKRFCVMIVRGLNGNLSSREILGIRHVAGMGHGCRVLYEGTESEGKTVIEQKGGEVIEVHKPSLEEIFIAYVKHYEKESKV